MKKLFTFFILIILLFLYSNIVFADSVISIKNRQATSVTLSIDYGLPTKYPVSFVVLNALGNSPEYFSTQLTITDESGAAQASFTGLTLGVNYHGYVWYASEGEAFNVATIDFTAIDMPTKITNFSPTEGKVGDTITITGENFINVSWVFFGTGSNITKTNSPTEITVRVPPDATSGKITVHTANGDAISSKNFTVTTSTTSTSTDTSTGTIINTTSTNTGKTGFSGLVPKCNTGEVITIAEHTELIDGKTVIVPTKYEYKNPCDFNSLVGGVNKFINFVLITLATPLFALILIYVGWLYLSAGGNSENVTKAKNILKNALIGYIIALAAWLIVKTILTALGFTGPMFLG